LRYDSRGAIISAIADAYGRNDNVVGEPAFETESRHAEGAVLIIRIRIAQVITRLGHSPRHILLAAIFDLTRDSGLARDIEQRCFRNWASRAAA
jgi:hypothetical protein